MPPRRGKMLWLNPLSTTIYLWGSKLASTSNLSTSLKSQWNADFSDILSVRKYCQLFTHESANNTSFCPFKPIGTQMPKNPQSSLFPLHFAACGPHLIHQCLGPPTHHVKRQLDRFTHFHTTAQQRPKFTPKTAPSLRGSPPHLIHPFLDWPHSPSQIAFGSNQPFCHSTLSRQTDRQMG